MGGPSICLPLRLPNQIRVSGFPQSLPTNSMVVLQICHATYFPIIYGSPQPICQYNRHSVVKYCYVSTNKNIVTGQQLLSLVFRHSRLVAQQNGSRCPPFICHVISYFLCHSIKPSSSSTQGNYTLANQEPIRHVTPSQVKLLVLQMSTD